MELIDTNNIKFFIYLPIVMLFAFMAVAWTIAEAKTLGDAKKMLNFVAITCIAGIVTYVIGISV